MLLLAPPQSHRASYSPAYVVLILGTLLGSCLLVMACHWLTIYLSLTLLSLASALLIGSQKTPRSAEASLKYMLYSMTTTAVMLWGMAYFYGFTGTLALIHPSLELSLQTVPGYIVLTSLLLCCSGVLLVVAAVPYHFWVPDVYQGASAAAVAYLSTAAFSSTLATARSCAPGACAAWYGYPGPTDYHGGQCCRPPEKQSPAADGLWEHSTRRFAHGRDCSLSKQPGRSAVLQCCLWGNGFGCLGGHQDTTAPDKRCTSPRFCGTWQAISSTGQRYHLGGTFTHWLAPYRRLHRQVVALYSTLGAYATYWQFVICGLVGG